MLFLNQKRLRKNNALADMSNFIPSLIPRRVLLGSPKRWQPMVSPDGARIAYLAPNEHDALQIWIRTIGKSDDRCVSNERRSIHIYEWAWDSKTILYRQDNEGDKNFHIYAIDLETGNARDLIPWPERPMPKHDDQREAARRDSAGLNVRDRKLMDVWRSTWEPERRRSRWKIPVTLSGGSRMMTSWRAPRGSAPLTMASKCAYAPTLERHGGRSCAPRPMKGYFRWPSTRMGARYSPVFARERHYQSGCERYRRR